MLYPRSVSTFSFAELEMVKILKYRNIFILCVAKFDGIKGQELLDVEQDKDGITLIFKDNRFLFIKVENGQVVCESVPE
jgi:hypothetical protein